MKTCEICKKERQIIVQCPKCKKWFCGLCAEHKHKKERDKVVLP